MNARDGQGLAPAVQNRESVGRDDLAILVCDGSAHARRLEDPVLACWEDDGPLAIRPLGDRDLRIDAPLGARRADLP